MDDTSLQWLYQNCRAFIYPSLFEGFGLPVLEAMSLGAVVITSNTSSIPEIVGGDGFLINPEDKAELAGAMLKVLNLDAQQIENYRCSSLNRASLFSWESTAKKVLQIYEQIGNYD
jgi:glycosyltransferase involved in cell wall biosynthesis